MTELQEEINEGELCAQFIKVHRKILDYDNFELPDQSHFLHNLSLLIQTDKLPLNSLAFNILSSNVRGLLLQTDFSDTEFRYDPTGGIVERRAQ